MSNKNKHMKKGIIILLSVFLSSCIFSQVRSIQERLGYPKDAKLVIIHADDLGVSHSENAASIAALEKGSVSSASMHYGALSMVPRNSGLCTITSGS